MTYNVDLRAVQGPLKERYRADPATAQVVTAAQSVASDLSDPRHCAVAPTEFPDVVLQGGLHPAAGGDGTTPCSGDLLAAALVICEETTLRSVAANMGLALEGIDVDARIHWDFRGTMGVDRDVPVAATKIELRTRVRVAEGVDPERARRLLQSAERYCSTLQTLRGGVPDVETDFAIEDR
ncbi:MAG: OsmC family protein [Candidatus Dormibacteraeota bacterium]|nr:OsmC family protein [Candidatus Dormibacteraeota bacterium]